MLKSRRYQRASENLRKVVSPMYIRHLQVQNLKRLNDFGLSFVHRGKPRMWTVLIGENGTAKTTLLQAIAMAAAGSKQVNALAAPIVKHLKDRRHDGPMSITADFEFTPSSRAKAQLHPHAPREALASLGLRSRVSLESGTSLDAEAEYVKIAEDGSAAPLARDSQEERAPKDPLDVARGTHENLWFVAGYGISRVLPDPSKTLPLDRPSIERLMPLFSAEASIASTSFSNHFLTKDVQEGRKQGTTSRMYSRMLNEVIKLGGEDLLPDVVKMELRGQGGVKSAQDLIESDRFQLRMGKKTVAVPGVGMSHGYQSTFAWIADLVGHVLLECLTELKTTEIEGLVLLDEIDLYLHPTWQATFITALRRVFPRVQFVATTHSPVVLAGLAPHEIIRLIVEPD